MSNLFLFQPNKQQDDDNMFFEANEFGEEEEIQANIVDEFDDDKNDDTFGDATVTDEDVMSMMTKQSQKMELSKSFHMDTPIKQSTPMQSKKPLIEQNYNNDDVLSSILNTIDDDEEEDFQHDTFMQKTPSKKQAYQDPAWNSPFLGNTYVTPHKTATPQMFPKTPQQGAFPYSSPPKQQPPQNYPPQMMPPQYHPTMSAEDLEMALLHGYNVPQMGVHHMMNPQVRQMFEHQQQPLPIPPYPNMFDPRHQGPMPNYPPQQTPEKQKLVNIPNMPQPVPLLQRTPQAPEKQPTIVQASPQQPSPSVQKEVAEPAPQASPAADEKSKDDKFKDDQPKFRQYKVYNTYLFPDANDGRSIPSYGYFPVYKHSFKDAKYMNSEDIEAIIRVQMADLIVSNAYVDDYYYCTYTNRYYYNKRTPQNFVQWVVDSVYEALELPQEDRPEPNPDAPRIFGKIGSQNVRAPRVIVDIDTSVQQEALSQTSLNKNEHVQLNCLIENGLTLLLQVEDLKFVSKNQAKNYSNDLNLKMVENGNAIMQMLEIDLSKPASQQILYGVLSKPKGIKFIAKCLKFLPDRFSVFIAQSFFLNWSEMYKRAYSHEESIRVGFFKDFCTAVSQFAIKPLCNTVNAVCTGTSQPEGDKMWSSTEGTKVLQALLIRASEVNKRQRNNDLRMVLNKLLEVTKTNAQAKLTTQYIQF